MGLLGIRKKLEKGVQKASGTQALGTGDVSFFRVDAAGGELGVLGSK